MVNEIDPIFDLCKRDELVVFDIGANTGVWTKALLNHSDKFIDKLYLFEPLPGNLDILYHRVSAGFYDPHTEKIEIVSKAVSDQVRLLNLNYDQEYTGYASISNNETLFGPQSIALSRQIQVESVTVDGFCDTEGIPQVDIMKIDVEGHEMNVLLGAERMLESHMIKNLIFEFGTHQLSTHDHFKSFWNMFKSLGYQLYFLRGGTNGFGKVLIKEYHTQFEDYSKVRMFYATVES